MNALLVCSVLAGGLFAQADPARQEWEIESNSRHYHINSNATLEQTRELGGYMDLVFKTYLTMLRPKDSRFLARKKFDIYLYRDREDFIRGGAPPGAAAYYSPMRKCLVGYYCEEMKPYFAHEGMHQFVDMTVRRFEAIPMWFHEGMADCIGNNEVRDKKLFMCIADGPIAKGRLWVIRSALKQGKAHSLRELINLSREAFMADASLCYAQSWSFCHFLMTAPKVEDEKKQIPDGKYRKRIAVYYEIMRADTKKPAEGWALAFAGIDIDELEKEWKAYVLETLPEVEPEQEPESEIEPVIERVEDPIEPSEDGKKSGEEAEGGQKEEGPHRHDVFQMLDRNRDGKLAWEEFREIIPPKQRKEIKKSFDEADEDGDGALTREEFQKLG